MAGAFEFIADLVSHEPIEHGIRLVAENAVVQIRAVAPSVFRVQV
jgi:hypothetical protein